MSAFEYSLDTLQPDYHLWRAATFRVAEAVGARVVREWRSGRTAYVAFDRELPQDAIVLAAAFVGVGT